MFCRFGQSILLLVRRHLSFLILFAVVLISFVDSVDAFVGVLLVGACIVALLEVLELGEQLLFRELGLQLHLQAGSVRGP